MTKVQISERRLIDLTEKDLTNLVDRLLEKRIKQLKQRGKALPEKDELMTVEELCKYLKLKPATIYSHTSNRSIPHIKKGKQLYFSKKEVDAWLSEGKVKTFAEAEREALEQYQRRKS